MALTLTSMAAESIEALQAKRASELEIVTAAKLILSRETTMGRASVYCAFTAEQTAMLMKTAIDQDFQIRCMNDIAAGRELLPPDSFFFEKLAKAQQDINEIDREIAQLKPDASTPRTPVNPDLLSAEKTYKNILANDPTNVDVIRALAQVLKNEGKFEESSAILKTLPKGSRTFYPF